MFSFLKRIFAPEPPSLYGDYLEFRRDFEAVQDELSDLKTRFNRFQARQSMREARMGKVDPDLVDEAREIAGKGKATEQTFGPRLIPGTFRRRNENEPS